MRLLHPFAMMNVCMNFRAIAVLKNSRDWVLSPSSMMRFFSLNETFDSARVRISTAGFLPCFTAPNVAAVSFWILPSVF